MGALLASDSITPDFRAMKDGIRFIYSSIRVAAAGCRRHAGAPLHPVPGRGRVAGVALQINDLNGEVNDLEREVGDLELEVIDLKREVSDMERQLTDLMRQVADFKAEVADMAGGIDSLAHEAHDIGRDCGAGAGSSRHAAAGFTEDFLVWASPPPER